MLKLHNILVGCVTDSSLLKCLVYSTLLMTLSSCSANLLHQHKSDPIEDGLSATQFSIVCVIHGDGDYLYHDTSGIKYKADEEALAKIFEIAKQNPNAEVFIYHQKPSARFLSLFPIKDGEFFYYRNGRLINNESYWRDRTQSNFHSEFGLYRRFYKGNQNSLANIFIYFGHQIPEFESSGYDESYPVSSFTIHDFANGLNNFTQDFEKFDLLILATCFGGSPYTIGTIGPFAEYIIASPDNLHLSYFDLKLLERLDLSLRKREIYPFAKKIAFNAFEKLANDVQTVVSIALYDVDRIQDFLLPVQNIYYNTLIDIRDSAPNFTNSFERCDCAEIPAYNLPIFNNGVDVFFRPANFGRGKNKQSHSGWECWRYNEL